MTERVLVVGGGVGGLLSALALGRGGRPVTLLERDPLPPSGDAEAAFAAERRGAPQVHQTHGFLARLRVTLRERFPDVLDELLAAGGTTMPMTAALGESRPGDDDLQVIVIRRTTLEWVLREAVRRQPEVELRTEVGVAGLVGAPAGGEAPARVEGVRLDDGTLVEAHTVVASTGRRGDVGAWLAPLGVDVPETVHESGLMYLTRWYRRPGHEPVVDPKLGGDLGFVKYLGVPGDGDTLSVTLAVPTSDAELRAALSHPACFDDACRLLPGPDQFFRGAAMAPIGGVRPMSGLINRLRRFTADDGSPLVLGFHALGDAHTTTNPLYGRGCALAAVQAGLLADAFGAHPNDPAARAQAYEADNRREVEPWFDASVQMDRMGADPSGRIAPAGEGAASGGGKAMAAVFAAAATDPVIGRAIARLMHLLTTPAEMMADAEVAAAVAAVVADPEAHPIPPRTGPSRTELLEQLGRTRVA